MNNISCYLQRSQMEQAQWNLTTELFMSHCFNPSLRKALLASLFSSLRLRTEHIEVVVTVSPKTLKIFPQQSPLRENKAFMVDAFNT